MKQKFYTNTIQSKFIKSLLHDTPLPLYNTISAGDYLVKGFTYVYKKTLVRCTQSGVFGSGCKVTTLKHYTFGEKYAKYTETFQSGNSYYDSITHEWLGKLLRCYRDIYEIDLMPFYNCFSGTYMPNIVIRKDGIIQTITTDYKVVKVPIKFNKQYTICIDCASDVYFAPAVVNKGNFVKVHTSTGEVDLTQKLCNNNILTYNNLTFKTPLIYELKNQDENTENFYQRYEKNLYLLIQLPIDNYSSIVVLEGDYTNSNYGTKQVINAEYLSELSNQEINKLFLNKLSLLQVNDEKIYPFADRLIEYLLWNVISNLDTIDKNVKRVQETALTFDIDADFKDGVWTNYLRYLIYNNYQKDKKSTHLDNNGFVDKDVEKYILRVGVM